MTITVEQLPALLQLEGASLAVVSGDVAVMLRYPQPDWSEVPVDSTVTVMAVDLDADPSLSEWGRRITVEIDQGSGWETAYDSTTGFDAGWSGTDSAATGHSDTSPYAYLEVVCDQTGAAVFSGDITVQVRVSVYGGGFGYDEFGHYDFGYPTGTAALVATWSFDTVDLTAPKLLSAVPIDQVTIQLTFDDDMLGTGVDTYASVTTGTNETWDFSAGGETLLVKIDGGDEQTVTLLTNMWLIPSAVTASELASALSALVVGAFAEDTATGAVSLLSDTLGDDSSVEVTGGTANAILNFPTTASTGADIGVLDVTNYTIERNPVYPDVAVTLTPTSAEFLTDSLSVVNLTVNWPMTPTAPYSITVDGDVVDTSQNAIDPLYLSASFTGFEPDWPENRDTEIRMPQTLWDNWDPQQVLRAAINIVQEVEDLFVTSIDQFHEQMDPDKATENNINLMLYDLGNPFTWSNLTLTLQGKRKLVDLLPALYAYKGTALGVESAIYLLLGITVRCVPWVEDGWRLGEDYLGDTFPAEVVCSNAETYDFSGGKTLAISIDGTTAQTITFVDGDFIVPSAATAKEVVTVINDQLDGGSSFVTDPSTGALVGIISLAWEVDATVQITGGTAAAVLGFDTAIHHSAGGCLLGPSLDRAIRTFDIEVENAVSSDDEQIIIRIANYMKMANEHVGSVRVAPIVILTDEWVLGEDYLGEGTVLGQ